MDQLDRLVNLLEEKLSDTRSLIEEYDEAMDYASHCSLQGFAQGIEFAIEEARQLAAARRTAAARKKKKNTE